jgi:hypothetical protein
MKHFIYKGTFSNGTKFTRKFAHKAALSHYRKARNAWKKEYKGIKTKIKLGKAF